jgi:hypothetical protein
MLCFGAYFRACFLHELMFSLLTSDLFYDSSKQVLIFRFARILHLRKLFLEMQPTPVETFQQSWAVISFTLYFGGLVNRMFVVFDPMRDV